MKTKLPKAQQLPSGSWRVQVKVDGRRISVVDEDPGVAQAKALAIKEGLIGQQEKRKAMTLEEAIGEYIEARSRTLSPATIRGYEVAKKNRFRGLMQRNVWTITRRDVQTAVNQECRFVSAKTVCNAYGLVRPVLNDLGIDVSGVKLPQVVRPKKDYVQPEEIGALLEAARQDKHELPILMALWLGMRRSEILGLCWDCVDEEAGTITVRRTALQDKDNRLVLREGTKNRSSQRTIHCPPYIMDKLRELRRGRKEGRVFEISQDVIRRHIASVCEAAGVTVTNTHGLRHTNAAIMRHLGISDAHAMERGGWSEERTYKQTYSYVFDSAATEEDARIDDFLTRQLEKDTRKGTQEQGSG